MRGAIFPQEIGEDPKKDLHIRRCRAFTENSGEDQKNVRRSRVFTENIGKD